MVHNVSTCYASSLAHSGFAVDILVGTLLRGGYVVMEKINRGQNCKKMDNRILDKLDEIVEWIDKHDIDKKKLQDKLAQGGK